MKKAKYSFLEILFLTFYFVYPFYIYYLLAADDGFFHFNSFRDFFGSLIPSLISLSLTFLYTRIRAKNPVTIATLLLSTILFHLLIIYFLFYLFTTETYLSEKIISYTGVILTVSVLLNIIYKEIRPIN